MPWEFWMSEDEKLSVCVCSLWFVAMYLEPILFLGISLFVSETVFNKTSNTIVLVIMKLKSLC